MTLAANALTTFAAVDAAVPGIATQARVESLINAVSGQFERFCGRSFSLLRVNESQAGTGRALLPLDRYPIVGVESVLVAGTLITDYARTADLDESGMLYREDGWPLGAPSYPGLTADPDVQRARLNILVVYQGGYVLPKDSTQNTPRTLPHELEECAVQEVLRRLARPTPGLAAESTPGGWRQTWADLVAGLLPETVAVLESFKSRPLLA